MAEWELHLDFTGYVNVKVEADSWDEARNKGYDRAEEIAEEVSDAVIAESLKHSVYVRRQLGEPWLASCNWYDLHGPGDVVLAERAHGNAFTKDDIKLLHMRLEEIGLKVEDHWNGVGCSSVSFRCSDRVGTDKMTEEQLTVMNAPRPEPCGDCGSRSSYADLRDPSQRIECKCGKSLCEPCGDAHSNYDCVKPQ